MPLKTIIKYLLLISILIPLCGCSYSGSAESKEPGVIILESSKNFESDYNQLNDPKGIMPTLLDIGRGNRNIILKTPNKYYEYFVFDKDTSLILLTFNPFFYIKIKSRAISSYLEAEYMQFISNVRLTPEGKEKNSAPFFEKIGDMEVSLMFTPSQVSYSDEPPSGDKEIIIKGNNLMTSPSEIIRTSPVSVIYTPRLEESSLYNTLNSQINSGMTRYVYTTDSTMFPPVYSEVQFNMNFSFMAFSPVEVKTGEKPNRSDYNQCVFFSAPLGDSALTGEKDYLNICHSIVLICKGNISGLTGFLEAKGFNFETPPPFFNKLFISEDGNASPTVTLDWIANGTYKIEYRLRNKNPEVYPDTWYSDWTTLSESHSGITFTHTGVERGFQYYYRITDTVRNGITEANYVIAKDPSVPTNRSPVDGTITGELAFSELCLLGSVEETILQSGTVLRTPQSDTWIEIKNVSDRIVRMDNINFYYTDTDPPSESSADIIFGPDCMNTGTNYLPVKEYIYPGDYYVITRTMDYIFSEMFIYNITKRYFPKPLPVNNTLRIKISNLTIDAVDTDVNRGMISEEASQTIVYAKRPDETIYMWLNSRSSFVNINPNSAYAGFNNCTPGISDINEY